VPPHQARALFAQPEHFQNLEQPHHFQKDDILVDGIQVEKVTAVSQRKSSNVWI
jgi:hypothetical protein